jgi:hypothetical protein
VRVGSELGDEHGSNSLQSVLQQFASACLSHPSLKPYGKRNLFEFRSVPVFTVIHRMHEFMHKGVQYLDGVGIDWRNVDLVDAII